MAKCDVCFRHCEIPEGCRGFCGARICKSGTVRPANYGRIAGLALDPIEKKPLRRFHPGSMILSAGSYGCNLRCPFCQNYDISWSARAFADAGRADTATPEDLLNTAVRLKSRGNIGLAFTYNEPLIGWEFVRDTGRLIHASGLKNVLVTNGMAELPVLEALAPFIDAMNIDLKGFTERYYAQVLDGSLDMVKAFISRAVQLRWNRHRPRNTAACIPVLSSFPYDRPSGNRCKFHFPSCGDSAGTAPVCLYGKLLMLFFRVFALLT